MGRGNGEPDPGPSRTRNASKRLLDGSGEGLGAAQQALVNETNARIKTAAVVATLIQHIEQLSPLLPSTVTEGTEEDEIYRVITTVVGQDDGSVASTFNRRFDILFKEDAQCRDQHGPLHLIRRGELGMLMVAYYLRSIKWIAAEMDLAGAMVKLERIVKEMEYLCDVDRSTAAKKTAASTRKSNSGAKSKEKGEASSAAAGSSRKTKSTSEPEKDAFFDLIMAGRGPGKKRGIDNAKKAPVPTEEEEDRDYRPKKAPELSEEEEDEFEDVALDAASSSNVPRKRKILVVDGIPQAPIKKKKKAKPTPASAPTVEIIEIEDESDDEPRQRGKRGPKSATRDHYWPPVSVTTNGNKRWSFKCRHVGCSASVTFARTVGKTDLFGDQKPAPSLGNLATHLNKDHKGASPPSDVQPGQVRNVSAASGKIMEEYLLEGSLNPMINSTQANFLRIFAAWIIEDDLAFTTGETNGINRLFKFLHTRYQLPSDSTVRNTLAQMYIDMYEVIKSELADIKSKLALSTDTWTTRSMTFTFAGTIGSWISSDWQLIERVLDFHPIEDKEHEGEYAAIGLAKRLAELDVLEKLIAVSLDNAAPNDVLIRALSRLLREKFDVQFVPENSQIRCLAHVVNLAVQKLLAALDEAVDPAVEDDYIHNKDLPFHYNPGDDPDLTELEHEVFAQEGELETEEDDAVDMMTALASEFAGMTPLQKLRTSATKICSSPQRRKRFRCSAEKAYPVQLAPSGRKIATLMVVRDVRHRWNYTHAMIRRGLLLRKAIDSWVFEREELRPLLISTEQWAFLEAVANILEVFTQVTLQMSRSSTPTLPWVLPMYEMMLKHLRKWQADDNSLRSLRDAASAGLGKLEVYYSKARGCQLNVIATLLHPTLGMKWFRKLDAERKLDMERAHDAERAVHAKVLFEHAYQSYKEIHDADKSKQPQEQNPAHRSRPSTFSSFMDDVCMADVADVEPQDTMMGELERFWNAFKTWGGDPNAPLTWWKEHEQEFPIVSKMARDFLAIPGTSVSVERLFSSSRHLCHEARGSFKATTIMEAMLTKMWIKAGFLKRASLDCGRG